MGQIKDSVIINLGGYNTNCEIYVYPWFDIDSRFTCRYCHKTIEAREKYGAKFMYRGGNYCSVKCIHKDNISDESNLSYNMSVEKQWRDNFYSSSLFLYSYSDNSSESSSHSSDSYNNTDGSNYAKQSDTCVSCGSMFYSNGWYSFLRFPNGNYGKYIFCSESCIQDFKEQNNAIIVNEMGETDYEERERTRKHNEWLKTPEGKAQDRAYLEKMASLNDESAKRQLAGIKEKERQESLKKDRTEAKKLLNNGKRWLSYWYYIGQIGRYAVLGWTVVLLFAGVAGLSSKNKGGGILFILIGVVGSIFLFLVFQQYLEKLKTEDKKLISAIIEKLKTVYLFLNQIK